MDEGIRIRLADSLEHICSVGREHIDTASINLDACLGSIRSHRVLPGVFARFYDLVFAFQKRQYDTATALLREIVSLSPVDPRFEVLPFTVDALGDDTIRFDRLIDMGAENPSLLAPPPAAVWDGFDDRIRAALALIDQSDPTVSADLRSLVVQVIGAVPPDDASLRFRGASSLMLWGAVFINVGLDQTALNCAETLVHESAHQMLFGLARDEPLLINAADERYASPLRADPRPMDGVFHATFVSARIHFFYAMLKQRVRLDASDALFVDGQLTEFQSRFEDGAETVWKEAKLTITGKSVFEAAIDYMRNAA